MTFLRLLLTTILLQLLVRSSLAHHGLVSFNGFPKSGAERLKEIDGFVEAGDTNAIKLAREFIDEVDGGEAEVWARLNLALC